MTCLRITNLWKVGISHRKLNYIKMLYHMVSNDIFINLKYYRKIRLGMF